MQQFKEEIISQEKEMGVTVEINRSIQRLRILKLIKVETLQYVFNEYAVGIVTVGSQEWQDCSVHTHS